MRKHFMIAAAALLAFAGSSLAQSAQVGPSTIAVPQHDVVRHVSARTGSDAGDGTAARPWRSITHALAAIADAGSTKKYAVLVAAGEYRETTLTLKPHVDLYGGFDARSWKRDIFTNATILDGRNQQRIIVAANDVTIDGFIIQRGSVQGHGGGILAQGVSPTITNNVFRENTTLPPANFKPKNWHETAHDGGAIACINGCSAVVANNIFDRNTTNIGRGAGFACDNEATRQKPAAPRLLRNVFTRNIASVGPDSARSGDGGAMSFYGWCNGEIAHNVIAENAAPAKNDAGGVFLNLWAAPAVTDNIFVGNRSGDDAGAFFVGGQKHHYGTPLDPVPPKDQWFVRLERNVIMGNNSGTPTSGAFRATMMTRGVFRDNVTAENPGGVYTQRSEITLVNNTFVDNARNEDEERTAPGPIIWRNNIITGKRQWGAPVTEENNCTESASFVQDGFSVTPSASVYDGARHLTRINVRGGTLKPGTLTGRVVNTGDRWGVIRSNTAAVIEVWGDFRAAGVINVKPTYTVLPNSACASRGAQPAAKRINKMIELLEQGQPVYYAAGAGGYEEGRKLARTWADFIMYDMEHAPYDVGQLREFMRGLVDGGPTPSGHRTPAVVVSVPAPGIDAETVRANQWMFQQVLAQGVHGLHLIRARSPEAVKAFVQAVRYPIHHQAEDVLGTGVRGYGSHTFPAQIWGIDREAYLRVADVWPLNPQGEIVLGLKIEDPSALQNAEQSVRVPGVAFAEHGPRDMGLAYGYLEGRADPPVPAEVQAAGDRVLAATKAAKVFFLDNVLPDNVCKRLQDGVMIGAGRVQQAAEVGRRCTGRTMPW